MELMEEESLFEVVNYPSEGILINYFTISLKFIFTSEGTDSVEEESDQEETLEGTFLIKADKDVNDIISRMILQHRTSIRETGRFFY